MGAIYFFGGATFFALSLWFVDFADRLMRSGS